jgi:hypothetical protein
MAFWIQNLMDPSEGAACKGPADTIATTNATAGTMTVFLLARFIFVLLSFSVSSARLMSGCLSDIAHEYSCRLQVEIGRWLDCRQAVA